MSVSAFFYGFYDGTFNFVFSNGATFDYPLAYFLVMLSVFIVNLVAVVYASAKSFHVSSYSDAENCKFGSLVFGSWDFRINKKAAVGTQQMDVRNRFRFVIPSIVHWAF